MIEFSLWDGSLPPRISKIMVLLDQVTHVTEGTFRGGSHIHLANGKSLFVWEDIKTVEKRIRDYAETAQRERITKIVVDEIAKQLHEIMDKSWRYDENSK